MNQELAVGEGHAKVAVKATDVGGGNWRYDYAVMNFDFARAVMEPADGSGPNVRVLGNRGFDSFSVPLPSSQAVVATSFSDGTADGANPWTVTTTPVSARIASSTAPSGASSSATESRPRTAWTQSEASEAAPPRPPLADRATPEGINSVAPAASAASARAQRPSRRTMPVS